MSSTWAVANPKGIAVQLTDHHKTLGILEKTLERSVDGLREAIGQRPHWMKGGHLLGETAVEPDQ